MSELPASNGATLVAPRALSEAGLVVGLLTAPPQQPQAAVWGGSSWKILGAGEAAAINASGQSAGFLATGTQPRATEWDRQGRAHDLGTLPGGLWSQALAINAHGSVAGYAQYEGSVTHGFIWRESQGMRDLGALGSGNSYGFAINRAGQVAGSSDGVAVLWDAQQRIHDLGAGPNSIAYALNDAGVIVGATAGQAFTWQLGRGVVKLEVPAATWSSSAVALNSRGLIVGAATLTDDRGAVSRRAVMWRDGRMIDLNTLIDANSNWELTSAVAVNDRGQIVGSGLLNGQPRAFLLTPGRR